MLSNCNLFKVTENSNSWCLSLLNLKNSSCILGPKIKKKKRNRQWKWKASWFWIWMYSAQVARGVRPTAPHVSHKEAGLYHGQAFLAACLPAGTGSWLPGHRAPFSAGKRDPHWHQTKESHLLYAAVPFPFLSQPAIHPSWCIIIQQEVFLVSEDFS